MTFRIECGTKSDPEALHIEDGSIYVTHGTVVAAERYRSAAEAAPPVFVLVEVSLLAAIIGWLACRLFYRIHR